MEAFRRLLYAALCAGLLAGLVAAAAHQVATVPLILKAESYEQAAAAHPHEHSAAAPAHAEAAAEWAPEDGLERAAFTLAADVLTAIGFALLLGAGMLLRGDEAGWREGLFWGLGGFAAFTLAPGLGLPPELPGSDSAALVARQVWWVATAAATGAGLALLAFTRRPGWAALAAVLLVFPHLWGAPLPAEPSAGTAPAALQHQFAAAAMWTGLAFWTALGTAIGFFYRRFGPAQPALAARA